MDGASLPVRTRVLIADDHEINRFVLARMLEICGAVVVEASSGAEAVRLAGLEAFDLVMLDLSMPRMGGDQALGLIREPGALSRGALAVAVSADIAQEDRPRLTRAGFDRFIEKPLRTEDIQAVVGEAVGRRLRIGRGLGG